jgi:hypothetical protein
LRITAIAHSVSLLLRGVFSDKSVQQQNNKNSSEKKAYRSDNGRVIE